ncbi:MAG: hypothetical protein RMK91_00490 [Pseudanabaenaceae cyanobacterium SKYGB_i_bin29]|nr:hypothetical protein [Pseudanabaenaceae cyanobacterium SKYG29]MDW8420328.1 hypothetical protein [Pseudanabaenaceae cyanobacterium SKYGB_i_bin29]
MDNLEQKFKQLEQQAEVQTSKLPLVTAIKRLKGWQKIAAVVVVGVVLFAIVQFVVNLLVGIVTLGIFVLLVSFLYRLFFKTDRGQSL